jgi:nicotinate-nucleotide pyrophosphorylase (carboxylating)
VIARQPGVLSGSDAAARVFEMIRPRSEFIVLVPDGTRLEAGDQAARITGPLSSILIGERTALNFLQRMSGIATLTRLYADALAPFPRVTLLDTRKTTPGLRFLERAAVRAGGGHNHRDGLWDAILIKDNHVAIAGGITPAIEAAQKASPELAIEVEVDDLDQLDEALRAGADTILLDNMHPGLLREAVARTRGRARLEASGGITLDTVRAVAETGVDAISIGALTHSVTALDVSLEVHPWQS